MSTITDTKKKCLTCEGIIRLELSDTETIVFCENYCFEKRKVKPVRLTRGSGEFAEYREIGGKTYLRTNKTKEYFREAMIKVVKNSIRVCLTGEKIYI